MDDPAFLVQARFISEKRSGALLLKNYLSDIDYKEE
jgi:hypothetical protein